jgi:NADPH:quinone reductase-like Zn-dependent oxidoreductase
MAVFGEIARLIAEGKLEARVQATYSLDHIKEAVQAAASGARDGKIIVEPNGPPRAAI